MRLLKSTSVKKKTTNMKNMDSIFRKSAIFGIDFFIASELFFFQN